MQLISCEYNKPYIIDKILEEEDTKNFLFTLGCYEGEYITVVSKLGDNLVVNLKDGRYGIDKALAKNIEVIIS